MSPEGELRVRVLSDAGRVVRTELISTRPHLASRVLSGRTPAEAVIMVSRLYSICGKAQGIAAALACEAASGGRCDDGVIEARRLLAGGELVIEGLWRALIDWPAMLGLPPQTAALAAARDATASALTALEHARDVMARSPGTEVLASAAAGAQAVVAETLRREVLGVPFSRWSDATSTDELMSWASSRRSAAAVLIAEVASGDARFGASAVGLMPEMTGERVERELGSAIANDPAFARKPEWQGAAVETGPLARMHAHPLVVATVERSGRSALARIVARIAELCAFASGALPMIGSRTLGEGRGIAWVETSRGLLVHRVELAGDRIRDYRIVAPTEWNFHPEGALVRGLEGAAFEDESALRRGVRLLVQSLDPCVAWKMELEHA